MASSDVFAPEPLVLNFDTEPEPPTASELRVGWAFRYRGLRRVLSPADMKYLGVGPTVRDSELVAEVSSVHDYGDHLGIVVGICTTSTDWRRRPRAIRRIELEHDRRVTLL